MNPGYLSQSSGLAMGFATAVGFSVDSGIQLSPRGEASGSVERVQTMKQPDQEENS